MINNTTHTNGQQVYYVAAKSRVSYILLALFLGGLGMHDFYAGYTGKGFLKILISFLGAFLASVGTIGTAVAVAASSTPGAESGPQAEQMAVIPLLGFSLIGLQSFYILIQMCTVTQDSKGVPFC